jgi:hypothetical protein
MKILTPAEIERKRIREGVEEIKRLFDEWVQTNEGARILVEWPKDLEEGIKNSIPLFKKSGWDVRLEMERVQSRDIKEGKFLGIIQTKEIIPTEIKKYYLVFEPIKKGKKSGSKKH